MYNKCCYVNIYVYRLANWVYVCICILYCTDLKEKINEHKNKGGVQA